MCEEILDHTQNQGMQVEAHGIIAVSQALANVFGLVQDEFLALRP
jgi:hypothetical protein